MRHALGPNIFFPIIIIPSSSVLHLSANTAPLSRDAGNSSFQQLRLQGICLFSSSNFMRGHNLSGFGGGAYPRHCLLQSNTLHLLQNRV